MCSITTPTRKRTRLAVLSILTIARSAMAAEEGPLPDLAAGTVVRIEAPKTIHIPGVLTARHGRTEWSAKALPEDRLFLAATVEGWNEPIATPKPGGTLRATIVSADANGLVVTLDGRDQAVRVPNEAIARLDVSRGSGSRTKHAFVGGAVGLGIGLAFTGTVAATCKDWGCVGTWVGIVATPVLGLGGAVFGAASSPGDRWEPVPMKKVSVGIAATGGGGVGVRVGLSF